MAFFIEEKEINIDKGDAIIYLGCEVKHSRKPFDCKQRYFYVR